MDELGGFHLFRRKRSLVAGDDFVAEIFQPFDQLVSTAVVISRTSWKEARDSFMNAKFGSSHRLTPLKLRFCALAANPRPARGDLSTLAPRGRMSSRRRPCVAAAAEV